MGDRGHELDRYDVIIVGASICGGLAAKLISRGLKDHASILLLDQKRVVGSPIQCAEAYIMNRSSDLIKQVNVPSRFFTNESNEVEINTIGGKRYYLRLRSTVIKSLDREKLEKYYVQQARMNGVTLRMETKIKGYDPKTSTLTDSDGNEYAGGIIVDASGTNTVVGTRAGLVHKPSKNEFSKCVQYTIQHPDVDNNMVRLWFDTWGGYIWSFPKGGRMTNMGMGYWPLEK